MRRGVRGTALLLVGAVVLSACGSRLSEDEIALFASQGIQGPVPGSVVQEQAVDGQAADEQGGGIADPSDPDAQQDSGSFDVGGTGGQGAGDGGQATGDQEGQTGHDGGPTSAAPTDTRAAPPGGNGGATDVGVTESEIVVYQVTDLTGAVPGLFEDTLKATQAYFAYFGATEGTVYGRQIRLVSRDTGLSSNGNRSAYLDACDRAFAAVGSMSAFEEGAADPLSNCSPTFPDLRNTPTSKALQQLPNAMGVKALRAGEVQMSEYEFYKETFPDAITNAGYVFLDNTTTQFQTQQNRDGAEKLGYVWNAVIDVATSETNYARIVNELRSKDIRIVFFMGAYQQAARLVEAMHQQGYAPDAFALQTNIYTREFIEVCRGRCDDFVYIASVGALLEEMDTNPEMQLYAEWLARVSPGSQPTGLGMFSWAAARLFVQALKDIGPEPTREKLLDYLQTQTSAYDGGGLFPPQNVGTQQATDCVTMLRIVDHAYVRVEPGTDYRCRPAPLKL
jgi:hypothetical protein